MSNEEEGRKFTVTVPNNIGIRWTHQDRPMPYLVNEDSDEPLEVAEAAVILSLLDPSHEQRHRAFFEHGIATGDAHDYLGTQDRIARLAYEKGYERGQADALGDVKPADTTPWHVYLIRGLEHHKIGISTDVDRRLRELKNSGGASSLQVVASGQFEDRNVAGSVERHLHHRYRIKRVHGEWFDLNDDEIEEVCRMLAGVLPISLQNDDEIVTETLAAE